MITRSKLKELFNYDYISGKLTRSKTVHYNSLKGSEVGVLGKRGYLEVTIEQKSYKVHRIIWLYVYGEWPDQIDHVNGIRTDNRISNLRNVSVGENNKNLRLNRKSKTGIMGVGWHKETGKWRAYIKSNGSQIYLGLYSDFFEACCVRKSAERKYGFHLNHGRVL